MSSGQGNYNRVRPYLVTGGRVEATQPLDHLSYLESTGRLKPTELEIDHAIVLAYCAQPRAIVEIAGLVKQPTAVVKILAADLLQLYAVTIKETLEVTTVDVDLLERVINGLKSKQ